MRIFVLFNLKSGADANAYEEWARTRDLPGIRALVSVAEFQLYRATGLLGGGGSPSHQYLGVIDVDDMDGFGVDINSDPVKKIESEFREFADDVQFILTEVISEIRT